MDDGAPAVSLSETAREKLRQVVAKIERLEEEKKEVAEQIGGLMMCWEPFGSQRHADFNR